MASPSDYTEENIQSLAWQEHLRLRPGMYIGKLGNGEEPDDGIYILLKEVIDNSIDEFIMGYGKQIHITITEQEVEVRDFGRGIPLKKMIDCVAVMNTGGKYDNRAFQKSVGLNGVGIKAVSALSSYFKIQSFRDGLTKSASFSAAQLQEASEIIKTKQSSGTHIVFKPDKAIFGHFGFSPKLVQDQISAYTYLNPGLTLDLNGKKYASEHGLLDLLRSEGGKDEEITYPIIHLKGQDIEIAFTHHLSQANEVYYTFVNGQPTTQGGTHLSALKEVIVKTIREFYKKNFEVVDIRSGCIVALSIRIGEPIFESQTKTKLGSQYIEPSGPSIRSFIFDFLQPALNDFLHQHPEVAEELHQRIIKAQQERKAWLGIKKLVTEKTKKTTLHNKKLRDCRIHYNSNHKNKAESTIFITEGNSASGSITQSRNVDTQAVFSLRGKPVNCFGQSQKLIYENEELHLLQHALNIMHGIEGLRYNKIVIATDADVDGMHIRLLILTYFLQFFPSIAYNGHLYILETPLFRVRNQKQTQYCYTEQEKEKALTKIHAQAEVTRFKGLGEISPDEFSHFIGKKMRLTAVNLEEGEDIHQFLAFYMGKNNLKRQQFIINHLQIEEN